MNLRLIWICCLIIVSAGLTLWFLNQRDENRATQTETISIKNKVPSVIFNEIEMTINSPEGMPQYKLSAPTYWLYHQEKRSEFELPDITIFQDDGKKILAKALKGESHDNNEVITLIGSVKINQVVSQNEPDALEITTRKLKVFPKQQQATTKSFVTAIRGPQKVTSQGMTVDLEQQILYLHSNVQGYYAP